MWTEYDIGVNTFSPEGRFFLVEYAIEAIKLGSTAIESVSLRSCWLTCEPTTQALCALALQLGQGEEESTVQRSCRWWQYFTTFRTNIFLGMIYNTLGMVFEFASVELLMEKSKTVGKRKVLQGYEHTAVVSLASFCKVMHTIGLVFMTHADPNQWDVATCTNTMEFMKPMDMFQLLKILTRILTKAMVVLDNQHHQQQSEGMGILKILPVLSHVFYFRFKGLVADGSRLLPLGQAVRFISNIADKFCWNPVYAQGCVILDIYGSKAKNQTHVFAICEAVPKKKVDSAAQCKLGQVQV
ncbi:hypothetical protein C5167_025300 [Papaver somniferum]|uniref:Proteasome alpha-type subunits domain-containing protein n=1 Tax=Papaver somniferum TaxID=3469 RepID=A0A4Y7JV13_PAPSO|nr:hypothetical protein C5167_025300 [Papaver somniferum]